MIDWELVATLPRDRFSPGESVNPTVRVRYTGAGRTDRPNIAGGDVSISLRRPDGSVEDLTTPPPELPARRSQPFLPSGAAYEQRLDLGALTELSMGSYEAVFGLVFAPAARSAPLRFTIEPVDLVSASCVPTSARAEGERAVVRVERTSGGAQLMLTYELPRARVTRSLGDVPPGARPFLAVAPEGSVGPRPWVLLQDGAQLRAMFVHFAGVERLDPVAVEGTLVAACDGEARGVAPDDEPWPVLHALLVAPPALVGATIAPRSAAPVFERQKLPSAPRGAALVPIAPDARLAVVVLDEDDSWACFAHPWRAKLGEPRLVLRGKGRFIAVDAAADEGRALVAVLFEDEEGLAVAPAEVEASGEATPLPVARASGLEAARLRVTAGGRFVILGTLDGKPALLEPGDERPRRPSVAGRFWDVELGPGRTDAVSIDPDRGVVVSEVPEA
ncbi:MAG TPA: hypothetical protein VFF73_00485 [Planctomycetota bacterium]|nr:hypothetical protein [Planctomycetota bacterium]